MVSLIHTVTLLFGSRLQLLYIRLKVCIFLVNLSGGTVCCLVLGFIHHLRALYYVSCVVLFWRFINRSKQCGLFLEIVITRGPVLYCVLAQRNCCVWRRTFINSQVVKMNFHFKNLSNMEFIQYGFLYSVLSKRMHFYGPSKCTFNTICRTKQDDGSYWTFRWPCIVKKSSNKTN